MSTIERIRNALREVTLLPEVVDQLDLDDSLFVNGVLDSLSLIRLITVLEREFGKPIPFETVSSEQFGTLSGLNCFVEESLKESKL